MTPFQGVDFKSAREGLLECWGFVDPDNCKLFGLCHEHGISRHPKCRSGKCHHAIGGSCVVKKEEWTAVNAIRGVVTKDEELDYDWLATTADASVAGMGVFSRSLPASVCPRSHSFAITHYRRGGAIGTTRAEGCA